MDYTQSMSLQDALLSVHPHLHLISDILDLGILHIANCNLFNYYLATLLFQMNIVRFVTRKSIRNFFFQSVLLEQISLVS